MPSKIQLVITTKQEKHMVTHEKILFFHRLDELESLVSDVRKFLLGKQDFKEILVGVDQGAAIGLVAIADGKVIEEAITALALKK